MAMVFRETAKDLIEDIKDEFMEDLS